MPAAGHPIGPDERDHLLRDVLLPVAVAVSGGADSTALMHLVAGWAKDSQRTAGIPHDLPPVLVVTVDHGLRPESAEEAAWVGREAERLGLVHVILRWTGPKPRTAIQEASRAARYSLICEHIGRELLPVPRQVLLAHHLDDQAETVLMRLARGSGTDGLSGMREVEPRVWLRLRHPVEERIVLFRRPFLTIPKIRLVATLAAAGARWLQDPSNADVRFERVRLRTAAKQREALGLTAGKLALTARRLASARSALEADQHELARAAVEIHEGAWVSIDATRFANASEEVRLRLLQSLIGAFGGQPEQPRRAQLEDLLARLGSPGAGALTLGGAVIKAARKRSGMPSYVAVYREPGRQQLPRADLKPGTGLFWDRRFYLSLAAEHNEPVRVEPLGQAGFARLKRKYRSLARLSLSSAAAATLPSLWADGRLLAVAGLSATEPELVGPAANGRPAIAAVFAPQHLRAIYGPVRDDI